MSSELKLSEVLRAEHEAIEGRAFASQRPEEFVADPRVSLRELLHRKKRSALCLSGGGIRSATFALGVVQSLAHHGLLDCFDYLSTVSGGGYLGSWLTAWIHRHRDGLAGVCKELRTSPAASTEVAPAPLRHLRDYSNYLSPRAGVLSADTWTLAATYLRNLLLNWLVLLPVLLLVLAVPRFCVTVATIPAQPWMTFGALALGFVLAVVAIVYIGLRRPSARAASGNDSGCADPKVPTQKGDQAEFLSFCLAPLLGASACLTTYWTWHAQRAAPPTGPEVALFVIVVHVVAWLVYSIKTRRFRLSELNVVVLTAFLAGFLVSYAAARVAPRPYEAALRYACLATPLFFGIFLLAGSLFVGLGSRFMNDDDREWAARTGAWVLILTAVWLVGAPVVLYGPTFLGEIKRSTFAALTSAGGLSGLITILLGWSGRTSANKDDGGSPGVFARLVDLAPAVAAPVFVLFLATLLSALTDKMLLDLSAGLRLASDFPPLRLLALVGLTPGADGPLNHAGIVMSATPELILLFAGLMAALALVMSYFININKYSLHSMYRNRLIRAYLGASRPDHERRPNLFTGFDPMDNVGLARLWPRNCFGVERRRLFHVVNCALNLVGGTPLAWQERKAQSFTMSPLHCGSRGLGYRRSDEYGRSDRGDRGISLGTAVTISGAAANPNMGYHSSPLVTFLMALFNARLGWWLGNPGPDGEKTFRDSHPQQAVQPLIEEALGLTDRCHPYVHLSDGGHFENLGLYEMVVRRCHLILVSDAGCDPRCTFEDLGNAVRKIRIDLGVPIAFESVTVAAGPSGPNLEGGCAVGTIDYRCVDGDSAQQGTLLYLKPSLLIGALPLDVRSYATASRAFPQESTADQWFSESQFESYRALGKALADHALAGAGAKFAGMLHERPTT